MNLQLILFAFFSVIALVSFFVGVRAGRRSAFREALAAYDKANEEQRGLRDGKAAARYRGHLRKRR